jgi:hypothetical protein
MGTGLIRERLAVGGDLVQLLLILRRLHRWAFRWMRVIGGHQDSGGAAIGLPWPVIT